MASGGRWGGPLPHLSTLLPPLSIPGGLLPVCYTSKVAERATVTQGVQLGVEATPGTGVAANKYLANLGMSVQPDLNFNSFRPSGAKFKSNLVPGKDFSAVKLDGLVTYSEIVYLLSGLVSFAAPVQQGGTTAYKWTHSPITSSEDTIKTFTMEQGSAARAHKYAYGLVTGLDMEFTRDACSLSGSMIGQNLQDGITLTGSPSAVESMPVVPKHVSVFADNTSGGLGGTKLTRVLKAGVKLDARFAGLWAVDASNPSYGAHVETEPTAQFTLMVEADVNGMGLLTTARTPATKFVRIEAVSDQNAGAAFPYKLTLDMAGQVSSISEFSDQEGVYALEYTFDMVHDATFGKAFTFAATNKLTTL